MLTTAKRFLSDRPDRRRVVLICAVSISIALHAVLVLLIRPAPKPPLDPMTDKPLSLTLTLKNTPLNAEQSTLRAEARPKTSAKQNSNKYVEQPQLSDRPQTVTLPNATKLLDDAIQLARRQEAGNFEHTMRQKRALDLTTQEEVRVTPFAATTDAAGWTYVEIGGACLIYREGDPLEQFDEPVMMYTRCRSKGPDRHLFANLEKQDETPTSNTGPRTSPLDPSP